MSSSTPARTHRKSITNKKTQVITGPLTCDSVQETVPKTHRLKSLAFPLLQELEWRVQVHLHYHPPHQAWLPWTLQLLRMRWTSLEVHPVLITRPFWWGSKCIPSLANVARWQKGDCFDMSILLCSLLIGVSYDVYSVYGIAPKKLPPKIRL